MIAQSVRTSDLQRKVEKQIMANVESIVCAQEGCSKECGSKEQLDSHKQLHLKLQRRMDGDLIFMKSPKLHGFTDQTPTPSKLFGENLLKTPTTAGLQVPNPFEEQFQKALSGGSTSLPLSGASEALHTPNVPWTRERTAFNASISPSKLTTPTKFFTSIGEIRDKSAEAIPSSSSTKTDDWAKSEKESPASDSTLTTPVAVSASTTPISTALPFSGWTSDRPRPNTIPTIIEHLTNDSDDDDGTEESVIVKPFQPANTPSVSTASSDHISSPSKSKIPQTIASPIQKFHQRQAGASVKSSPATSPTKSVGSNKMSVRPKYLRLPSSSFKGAFDKGPIDTPTIINFVSDIESASCQNAERVVNDEVTRSENIPKTPAAKTPPPPKSSRSAATHSTISFTEEPSHSAPRQKILRPRLGKRQRSGGISEPVIAENDQKTASSIAPQPESSIIAQLSQSTSTISNFDSESATDKLVSHSITSTGTFSHSSLSSAPLVPAEHQLSLSSEAGGMYIISIPNNDGGSTLFMQNQTAPSSQPSIIIPPDGSCFVRAEGQEGSIGSSANSVSTLGLPPGSDPYLVNTLLSQVATVADSSLIPQIHSQQPLLLVQNTPPVTLAGSLNLPQQTLTEDTSEALSSSLPASIFGSESALKPPDHQHQIQQRLLVQSTQKPRLPKELERMNSVSLSSSFSSFRFTDLKLKKALEDAHEEEPRPGNGGGSGGSVSATSNIPQEALAKQKQQMIIENPSDEIEVSASSAVLPDSGSEAEDSAASQSPRQTVEQPKTSSSSEQRKRPARKRRGQIRDDCDDPEERKKRQLEANRAAVGRCRRKHKQKEKEKDDLIKKLEDALMKKDSIIAELTKENIQLRQRLGSQSQVLES